MSLGGRKETHTHRRTSSVSGAHFQSIMHHIITLNTHIANKLVRCHNMLPVDVRTANLAAHLATPALAFVCMCVSLFVSLFVGMHV